MTPTRIWELGLGGLLALLPERASRRLSRYGVLGWAGLGLVIGSAFLLSGTAAFPGLLALFPVGGAAALILGGSAAGRGGPHRLTSARPLVFLGGISYSLYLWHWPVIVLYTGWRGHPVSWISGPVIVAASVALAWLTKVGVEDTVRTARLLSGHPLALRRRGAHGRGPGHRRVGFHRGRAEPVGPPAAAGYPGQPPWPGTSRR